MTKDGEARVGKTRCERCGKLSATQTSGRFYCTDCLYTSSDKSASVSTVALFESIDDLVDLHAAD